MSVVGFEIALTRYFAVAKWSEYGYWVISIVLAGFALSGVAMALSRDFFVSNGTVLLRWLPAALIAAAAIGFHFVTTNPFNPLQLQNQVTLVAQLGNIAWYYVALLPFFFLAGVYIGTSFVLNDQALGRVYGFDLTGAGAGALAALALLGVVHPFALVPWLLLPIAVAGLLTATRKPGGRAALVAALLLLAGGEALLLGDNEAAFSDYKAIYAPLHVPDARVVSERLLPRGLYNLLDDFTERVDTDVSNNAAMLGLPGPPTSWGLYRDGNRLASVPKPGPIDAGYAGATLAALPYMLHPKARVLLAGGGGGFRIAELRALGAAAIDVAEPEPVLAGLLAAAPQDAPNFLRIVRDSPIALAQAAVGGQRYDIVDISGDFLDASESNTSAFAAEALATDLRALTPTGLLSIPVSIREFPAYALRMLATVRAALRLTTSDDPAAHVLVYRSAWTVRILVSPTALDADTILAAKKFCDDRSFDMSFYPGIDVVAARAGLYNDLPSVSFDSGQVTSDAGPHDAIADEAGPVLAGEATESGRAFDLRPITYDRPSFYSVLRLSQLGTILQRLEILPQAEIGALVNLAVLAQAVVLALIVLAVPLLARRRLQGSRGQDGGGQDGGRRARTLRPILYFSALGLGFLFLEIHLIERASFYLSDRTSGFALVLTGMLVFSGFGSMLEHRASRVPRRALLVAVAVVVAWCLLLVVGSQSFMLATLGLPWGLRAAIVLAAVAPVSLALGLPFPLGLSRMGHSGFLPWAWGLNGAFSVVATPLANLISLESGYQRLLWAAMLLYVVAFLAFPVLEAPRLESESRAPV